MNGSDRRPWLDRLDDLRPRPEVLGTIVAVAVLWAFYQRDTTASLVSIFVAVLAVLGLGVYQVRIRGRELVAAARGLGLEYDPGAQPRLRRFAARLAPRSDEVGAVVGRVDGGMVRRLALGLALTVAAGCGPPPGTASPTPDATPADPLAAAKACAPSGWTADVFPFGSRDYGFGPGNDIGRIRLITPESVASGKGLSKPGGATFITDWWTVTDHSEAKITFADGRSGTQYRSKAGGAQVTTEFTIGAGTWQLWTRSDEHYDEVLRCVEPRLAGTASPTSDETSRASTSISTVTLAT